jgi:hypothetical protein
MLKDTRPGPANGLAAVVVATIDVSNVEMF